MISYPAVRVGATATGTGIEAFLIYARLRRGTLRADDAFRSTSWWAAHVIAETGANSLAVGHVAQAVGSAGRGIARVFRFEGYNWVQTISSQGGSTSLRIRSVCLNTSVLLAALIE